ncbi:energy transducer TonB [Hymenobacter sp. BT559]|uniref:energy transducer TonB n=1 Tax=Hymenobacter sp. BT559 TaxID=2795729 RepID=UPI0018EAEC04|nr:energy transducer TonB [Hymenobacter sp. BT559]MBJ6142736.1 TonB family protein [Hymenobacter sp. BT559]
MRYVYTGICVLLAHLAQGQALADTLAYEQPRQTTEEASRRVTSHTDSTGLCVETLSWAGARGLVRIYYASGLLKEYVPYGDLGMGQVHGVATTWYESGQLESRQPFVQGKRDGKLELYYPDGRLKRRTEYATGAELPGQCFDETGRPVIYFSYEQLPLYPGGHAQLTKEINNALRWPRDVTPLMLLMRRTVCLSFVVDEQGAIQSPRVAVSSELPSLDRAVLATIAKLTRRFAPARRDGRIVQSAYYLPIQF